MSDTRVKSEQAPVESGRYQIVYKIPYIHTVGMSEHLRLSHTVRWDMGECRT